ncbi:MAG: hypothetical protein DMF72_20870 [Acidobacteria bacterium]|nr:MAG: hypothetical protein DMF72_20870 [Acidobacteriota bacterium]
MVDEEVEIVLREIRERVISQARTEQIASASTDLAGNGEGAITNPDETSSAAELARISGYLTTTARAWDRLPPVISNRIGAMSRLELWFKSRAKSLARWFTWEQVNFNAAVHHAIRDTLDALSRQQAAIASLRHEAENRQSKLENTITELSARVDALAVELRTESEARRIDFQSQHSDLSTMRAELHGESEARRIQLEDSEKRVATLIETNERKQAAHLSELSTELRARSDQIENEQRVSFKQLSLENSEAAAFQTTSRRKVESALAELEQRIEQLGESLKRGK